MYTWLSMFTLYYDNVCYALVWKVSEARARRDVQVVDEEITPVNTMYIYLECGEEYICIGVRMCEHDSKSRLP